MQQDKSDRNAIFSEKSEKLVQHLGINLDALPARIGISKDMFYAYRTGRHAVSAKAWRKLEAAEAAAGISPKRPEVAEIILPPLTPAEREAYDKKPLDEVTQEDWLRFSVEEPEKFMKIAETFAMIRENGPELAQKFAQMKQEATESLNRLSDFLSKFLSPPSPPKNPPPPRES
jgi:hypothetical protein